MEQIQSSGEENVGGIAALGKALVLLQRIGMELIQEEEQVLTSRALQGMAQINGLEIYGVKRPESPGFTHKLGVIVFGLKNKMATQVGKELALIGGIGVRTGCHCAHIIIKHLLQISPSLEKLQWLIVTLFPKLALPGLARVSFGIENTKEEVDTLIQVLAEIAGQPMTKKDGSSEPGTNEKPIFKKAEVQRQMDDFVRTAAERVYM
jgi:selenocysteine lyase/cysteine desulfurase